MGVIEVSNPIEGALQTRFIAGPPTGGTDEVQTLTLANCTGGTFTLTLAGWTTAPIAWSNSTPTMVAAIDSALEALPVVGAGGVVVAAGTLANGNGTVTITFAGRLQQLNVPLMTADGSALTGAGATVTVVETTPGVAPRGRGCPTGALLIDTVAGTVYVNTSATMVPTWTVVGGQA